MVSGAEPGTSERIQDSDLVNDPCVYLHRQFMCFCPDDGLQSTSAALILVAVVFGIIVTLSQICLESIVALNDIALWIQPESCKGDRFSLCLGDTIITHHTQSTRT